MKISLIIEGKTEMGFLPILRKFLEKRLSGNMPKIIPQKYDGLIPTEEKLKRVVIRLLSGKKAVDHVIALTDVYTGRKPPIFENAEDAKKKMRDWVGDEPRFHPHAAQYDFEAWLLPYWPTIQKLAKHNSPSPNGNPEDVNHNNPPAHRIKEIFRLGNYRIYGKPRNARKILENNNLMDAVIACNELRAFVNTIISISGGQIIQ
ncbi:MAG: DUF4276 family protein [Candidatus Magnetominusculus sp. LBB02]|nr:DUF4276 family protein [Candidatus Magnetominusculus sp. LBB02]